MKFDHELIQEIKSRADIVDVISSYINVIKKGRRYVAICPFHDDHDPSMNIDPEKQTFTCYVCHHSGDVFTFVSDYEKIPFMEAVKKVCEIINFDDPRLHQNEVKKPVNVDLQILYNCISELQKYYRYGLETEEGNIALNYLSKRKISEEQVEKFGFGYALNDGKKAISYLQQKGFSLKNIEDIGIALAKTSGTSDSNAGRLIVPIFNANGQVVAFSARRLVDDDSPKYVNSPETKIFRKGSTLYNYNIAKQTARHDGYIYIVEGFMDVLAFDAIGISSCIALMGTKLTETHIELLRKLNVEIRLCLDGDNAGQQAMMSLMAMFDKANLSYRLVSKPGEAKDPDEILKNSGPDELKLYVNSLVDPFDFALNYYKNISPLDNIEDRKKVVSHFAPMLLSIKSKFDFDDCLYKLAEATRFNPNAIKEYIKSIKKENNDGNKTNDDIDYFDTEKIYDKKTLNKELRRLTLAEKTVLEQMMNNKDAILFYEKNIKYFINEIYRQIANYLIQFADESDTINPSILMDYISSFEPENKKELLNEIVSMDTTPIDKDKLKEVLNECQNIIIEERNKTFEKRNLLKSLDGKSDQEKAKLLKDYINKTNTNDAN